MKGSTQKEAPNPTSHSDPLVFIPMAAIFVIVFVIVVRAMKEMPLFGSAGKVVLALCVSALAMVGMDQSIIKAIVIPYAALVATMLFLLAGLLLAAWVGIAVKERKGPRHSERPQDRRAPSPEQLERTDRRLASHGAERAKPAREPTSLPPNLPRQSRIGR